MILPAPVLIVMTIFLVLGNIYYLIAGQWSEAVISLVGAICCAAALVLRRKRNSFGNNEDAR